MSQMDLKTRGFASTLSADFKRNLVFSVVLHVVGVSILLFTMAFAPTRKPEPIQWLNPVDFSPMTSLPATAPEVSAPLPSPVPPAEPAVVPRPVPLPPKPTPERMVEPTPLPVLKPVSRLLPPQPKPNIAPLPKKPKPSVEMSTKLVTRQKQTASSVPGANPLKTASTFSAEQWKKSVAGSSVPGANPLKTASTFSAEQWKKSVAGKLQANVGVGSTSSFSSSGRPDPFTGYYALVRDVMFRNWREPALAQSLTAQVVISVARDGRVLGSRLTFSSGNPIMDQSVLECMRRVQKLDPLPPGLGDSSTNIVIDFKLHGGQ